MMNLNNRQEMVEDFRKSCDTAIVFVCPSDQGTLVEEGAALVCKRCNRRYPIVNDIPILLNEENSIFRIADYLLPTAAYEGASGYGGSTDRTSGPRRLYRRVVKRLIESRVPGPNTYGNLRDQLLADITKRVLVIGAGERSERQNVTRTDVAFATSIDCICDAHDLPFKDGAFEVVIVESVLEHVCDPYRCVSEIERVLSAHGIVCAITPFLQPVHMGAHDFTRFTYLGHRRLFKMFDDLGSGMCGGPIYSLIHLLRTFVAGLVVQSATRACLNLALLLTTYPLRYLDPFFSRRPGSFDSGCAFYFVGEKRSKPISDRDMIKFFRSN